MTHHDHNGQATCCPSADDEGPFKALTHDEGSTSISA